MRLKALATVSALVTTVALVGPAAHAAENITAGGSSFAANIIQTCAASYTADKITYASVGSGPGRNNFLNGTYDFGAADVGYSATDKKPDAFTYVPLIGGPIAIVFKIDGVTSLNLSAKVLGGILNGRYTKWNDTEIAALNPKAALPNKDINVVYRSGSSGTTQNLARFLAGNGASGFADSGTWATASKQSTPVGVSAANAQAVVSTVSSTANSIGYADLSDAASKGLAFAALRNGTSNEYVKPTVAAASKFLAVQKVTANGILDINYKANVKGGYNASLVTYALAPTAKGGAKGVAIKKFLTYVINSCAPAKGPAMNYVPLAAALKAKALALVATVK